MLKKTWIKGVAAVALLGLLNANVSNAQNGNNQNDNALIGNARSQVKECLREYNGPNSQIDARVEMTSMCPGSSTAFFGGYSKVVRFYLMPKCNEEPCPDPNPAPVAEVYYDCNGNLSGIVCRQ